MIRLYDRIMERPGVLPEMYILPLMSATVLDASNVAEYYFQHYEDFFGAGQEYTNIACPWEDVFLEARTPNIDISPFTWGPGGVRPHSWGLLVHVEDSDPSVTLFAHAPMGASNAMKHGADFNIDGVRWILHCHLLVEEYKGSKIYAPWHWQMFVRPDGTPSQHDDGSYVFGSGPSQSAFEHWYAPFTGDGQEMQRLHDGLALVFRQNYLKPMLLALSFVNCKNVIQRVVRPDDWVARNARKRNRPVPVTYRVLEIEPMKTVLRTEGGIERNGLKKALHICRGHFKTYDEKPLFGKVRGTFWVPAHVQGSLEEGFAMKDYAILAPGQKTRKRR